MQIATAMPTAAIAHASTAAPAQPKAPILPSTPLADSSQWKNPAAAAALQTSVDLLKNIEDGIVKHYGEVDKVRAYAADLQQSNDMFQSATDSISGDQSKDNDQFVPLIGRASGGVENAQTRLLSKDISSTWPAERSDILSAVRTAKLIAQNVSRQLDPLQPFTPAG
jgi:hypothetical protein